MSNTDIKWRSTHGEVAMGVVTEIEKKLGVKFPVDYVHCAKINNGGHPSLEAYDFDGRKEAVFNRLLSYHDDKPSYIVEVFQDIRDRLVDGIIPFANDPFGNHICFDYRASDDHPTIVFWDHELAFNDPEKGLFPVCSSFSELMSMLYD